VVLLTAAVAAVAALMLFDGVAHAATGPVPAPAAAQPTAAAATVVPIVAGVTYENVPGLPSGAGSTPTALPFTGLPVVPAFAFGLGLLGAGMLLLCSAGKRHHTRL